jgi:hypothetical protein
MPLPPGTRYRWMTTSTGKKVRLAFQGNQVIEAKSKSTGKVHTPKEFAADRRRARRHK